MLRVDLCGTYTSMLLNLELQLIIEIDCFLSDK